MTSGEPRIRLAALVHPGELEEVPARSASLLARSQSVVYSHERVLVGILLGALAAFFLLRGLLATLT
jgi:hypothetical protein